MPDTRVRKAPQKKSVIIGTVVLNNTEVLSTSQGILLLRNVLATLKKNADILIFPGGYFSSSDKRKGERLTGERLETFATKVQDVLSEARLDTIVVFGLDCRNLLDQLAVAVSRKGIRAVGRKFAPTKNEKTIITTAASRDSEEHGFPRIFEHKGHAFFLAVCYDIFGIKRGKDNDKKVMRGQEKNPGVDAILNCIHEFTPKGNPGSGESNYARHGLAGASKAWKCPVFASVRFSGRNAPDLWPSGVLWRSGRKSTTALTFKYISLPALPKPIKPPNHPCSVRIQLFRLE